MILRETRRNRFAEVSLDRDILIDMHVLNKRGQ